MESPIMRQAPWPRIRRPSHRVVQFLGGGRTSCFLFVAVEELWKDAINCDTGTGPGCNGEYHVPDQFRSELGH